MVRSLICRQPIIDALQHRQLNPISPLGPQRKRWLQVIGTGRQTGGGHVLGLCLAGIVVACFDPGNGDLLGDLPAFKVDTDKASIAR